MSHRVMLDYDGQLPSASNLARKAAWHLCPGAKSWCPEADATNAPPKEIVDDDDDVLAYGAQCTSAINCPVSWIIEGCKKQNQRTSISLDGTEMCA
jgi:hypothetical protein